MLRFRPRPVDAEPAATGGQGMRDETAALNAKPVASFCGEQWLSPR